MGTYSIYIRCIFYFGKSYFIYLQTHPLIPIQFENLSVYEPFLNSYPSTIVSMNTLYSKSSSFIKFLEVVTMTADCSYCVLTHLISHVCSNQINP